jgi:hypothetical protein
MACPIRFCPVPVVQVAGRAVAESTMAADGQMVRVVGMTDRRPGSRARLVARRRLEGE